MRPADVGRLSVRSGLPGVCILAPEHGGELSAGADAKLHEDLAQMPVSGPRVGARLTAKGHDVRVLDQEPHNAGLADEEVLRLAAREQRIVITHDVNTFPPVLRDFAERSEPHAGAIILVAIRSRDFDLIARAVRTWLDRYPQQEQWRDMTVFAAHTDATTAS